METDTAVLPGMELVPLGPAFVVDSLALDRRGAPATFAQCEGGLARLKTIYGAARYWLGDLMNLTEGLFAEESSQLIDASFLSEANVKAFTFVSKNVAATTRAHAQSWDHAKVVAALKVEDQVDWLDRSRADDWTARKLANEIAQAKADGKTVMRWWLVVECGSEAKRNKLADDLEARGGFIIKKQEKMAKVAKPKRKKKGPITAQKKHKGAPKMNRVKRVPK